MDQNSRERPQNPLANYQLSPDELRILKECDVESFFQRSFPLGTIFGVTTYLGVKRNFLQPNVKYGAIPKVLAAVVVGYFLGKFSYQQKCAEKLMMLPGSKLGETLRQRQKVFFNPLTGNQNLETGIGFSSIAPNNEKISEDSFERRSFLELDPENRPTLSGLEDIYRPSVDDSATQFETELPNLEHKQGVTYDELRAKNRAEYAMKSQNAFSKPLSTLPVKIRRPNETAENEMTENQSGQKNKYGDTWTN